MGISHATVFSNFIEPNTLYRFFRGAFCVPITYTHARVLLYHLLDLTKYSLRL